MVKGAPFTEMSGERLREIWRLALPYLFGMSLAVAVIALLYYASIASKEQEKALAQSQHSYEIIVLARRLDSTVAKAESNLARYVISMEPDTGRLYQEQWRNAGAQLAALAQATRRDPVQNGNVAQLREAYLDRGKTLADIGLRTTYDQKIASLTKYYEAGKAENLARINQAIERVIETESNHLGRQLAAVNQTSEESRDIFNTYRIFGLALVVALLSLLWFARNAMEDRKRQDQLAEAEADRAFQLEQAVTARTAELNMAYERLKLEIQERSAAEESLRHMQKMEAVGQLTGGIAHDFNNMLAVVVGGLELARRKVSSDPEGTIRYIDNAMEGAGRASALTRRLLSFARSQPQLPTTLDPEELVAGMTDLIDRTIGDQIKVALELHAGGWQIYADRHQLENAILNLAVNARDAMDGRGMLTIGISQHRLAPRAIGECLAGEYICMSVTDTGCGMTSDVLEHAFEPFFTTKPVGKGTGLGLSQIFSFVRQCNGEIRILSEPGQGTTVEIYLPRHIAITENDFASASSSAALDEQSGARNMPALSILLVEDDPRVLAQTRDALIELGHDPICRDHPSKCVEALESHRGIDLIVSDVMMPDMTGPEMIAALPTMFHSIPVLFISGYTGNATDSRLFDGYQLLRKPYTLASLARAIESCVIEPHRSATDAAAM